MHPLGIERLASSPLDNRFRDGPFRRSSIESPWRDTYKNSSAKALESPVDLLRASGAVQVPPGAGGTGGAGNTAEVAAAKGEFVRASGTGEVERAADGAAENAAAEMYDVQRQVKKVKNVSQVSSVSLAGGPVVGQGGSDAVVSA